jgi:hypothetical protein
VPKMGSLLLPFLLDPTGDVPVLLMHSPRDRNNTIWRLSRLARTRKDKADSGRRCRRLNHL